MAKKKTPHAEAAFESAAIADFSSLPLIKQGSPKARAHKQALGMVTVGGRHLMANSAGASLKSKPIHPGKERWSVKTGTDADIAQVNLQHRVETTVEELVAMPRPHDMTPPTQNFAGYSNRRAEGVETTVWTLTAEIIAHKEEDDGDFHLEIQGDKGLTMIAEAPNSDPRYVAPNSPFAKGIADTRKKITKKLKPERDYKKARVRARITGVGFFDRVHGQLGVAQTNGIELHPILHIEWL